MGAKLTFGCMLAALVACGGGSKEPPPVPTPSSVTKNIPTSGGSVELAGGPSLVFAAGALSAATDITIRESAASVPAAYGVLGKAYDLKPDGIAFGASVSIKLPGSSGSIWISSANGYDALATTIGADGASAVLPHFSTVFLGGPCVAGADCTPMVGGYPRYCRIGSQVCAGPPLCTDTGTLRPDGTSCCTVNGGQCSAGFCEAPGFVGTFRVSAIYCGSTTTPASLPLARWVTTPSTLTIVETGTAPGRTTFSDGSCSISQTQGVSGITACTGSNCDVYSKYLFGGTNICGQPYDDTDPPPVPLGKIPACPGVDVLFEQQNTLCSDTGSGANPVYFRFVRQ